jgi:hypothetical protein
MRQSFVFVATMLGIFLIVPLCILGATGNFRAAVDAAKGYGKFWLLAFAFAALGWLASLLIPILS